MTVPSNAEFERILADIDQRTEQMRRDGQRLIATVRQWRAALGPLGDPIDAMLIWIDGQLAAAQSTIAKLIPQPGVPWTLWSHGSDWSGPQIGGRISDQVGKATLDELRVDDFWTGTAAEAYKNSVARQKEALSVVAAFTRNIDDVLTSMAIAIGAFWLAMLAAVIEVILIIIASVGAASTGVGAPPAVAASAAGVAKFVRLVLGIITGVYTFVMADALPKIKDLRQDLYNNTAFPGGHWPRPRADLLDGSVSDGDPSDWQVRGA